MRGLLLIFISIVILILGLIIYHGAITAVFGEIEMSGTRDVVFVLGTLKLLQLLEGSEQFYKIILFASGILFFVGIIMFAIRIRKIFFK